MHRAKTDSKYSLDPIASQGEVYAMSKNCDAESSSLQIVVLERIDPQKNVSRFYVRSIEPTLFSEVSLVRGRGRIGGVERRHVELYETEGAARVELETWLARKRHRGYAIRQVGER
jgi:predicted DNA-binding WGR domain protein